MRKVLSPLLSAADEGEEGAARQGRRRWRVVVPGGVAAVPGAALLAGFQRGRLRGLRHGGAHPIRPEVKERQKPFHSYYIELQPPTTTIPSLLFQHRLLSPGGAGDGEDEKDDVVEVEENCKQQEGGESSRDHWRDGTVCPPPPRRPPPLGLRPPPGGVRNQDVGQKQRLGGQGASIPVSGRCQSQPTLLPSPSDKV